MRARSTLTLALLALVACGKSGTVIIPPPTSSGLPESLWIATAPADAKDLLAVRAEETTGPVTIIGRVGGDKEVFIADRALFTIVDRSMKDCNRTGDGCTTPWDYCCEDPTDLRKASVAVEIHADGKLAHHSARGFHGLDHGKTVIARGELRRDSEGNLSLIATGLHVLP